MLKIKIDKQVKTLLTEGCLSQSHTRKSYHYHFVSKEIGPWKFKTTFTDIEILYI